MYGFIFGLKWSLIVLYIELARFMEISVNRSIYKRNTIIDMKIQKSVTFNGVIASFYFLFKSEVP